MTAPNDERGADSVHHPFCSAGGVPCPLGCGDWPECAAECFPNLHPAEDICPWCKPGPCPHKKGRSTDG